MSAVILPGWGLGRLPLQAMAEAVNGQVLDLPGYGEAAIETNFDHAVTQLAEQILAPSTLIGWSLGAMISVAIAARFPEKISQLVLIAGTASFLQRNDWPHGLEASVLDGFKMGVSSDYSKTLSRFVAGFNRGDTHGKSVTQTLLTLASNAPQPDLDSLLAGLHWLQEVELCAELGNIRAPTLLIHGAVDPLMPLSAAEAIALKIPNAQLVVMPTCAHAPFISQPKLFMSHLQSFMHV
jgi:pimeloyl-[acyl-carrier protein] methyl ester esterase